MNKFIIGLLLGITIAGGLAYYLNNMPNQFVNKVVNNSAAPEINASSPIILAPGTKLQEANDLPKDNKPSQTSATAKTDSNASAPSYDFYDILQGKKAANGSETPKEKTELYYIQVGAFSAQDLANDMKAKLALMGIDAKIKSQQDQNKIINRVIVGPFNTKDDATNVLSRLTSENIQATLIRVNS